MISLTCGIKKKWYKWAYLQKSNRMEFPGSSVGYGSGIVPTVAQVTTVVWVWSLALEILHKCVGGGTEIDSQIHRHRKQTYDYQRGKLGWRDK